MDVNGFVTIMAIGLVFTAWSIVGRFFQVDGSWTVALVMVPTAIVLALFSGLETSKAPPWWVAAILIFLGTANGRAMIVYGGKVSDKTVNTSLVVVTVAVMMIVWAPVLDWRINGAVPTSRQVLAFVLALFVVYLAKT